VAFVILKLQNVKVEVDAMRWSLAAPPFFYIWKTFAAAGNQNLPERLRAKKTRNKIKFNQSFCCLLK
jgi:hypothetical protein